MADIEINKTNLEVVNDTTLNVNPSSHEAEVECNESTVSVKKKEYSIVGDGLYASVTADEAPQWLNSIIDSVIDVQISNGLVDLAEARNSIAEALAELDIAKNQYEELINIEATIDGIIVSKLETLNATVDQNNANIVNLGITKATRDEAVAIAAEQISAELQDGAIRSELNRIDTTVATTNETLAATTTMLESDFEDLSNGVSGNASATNDLYTYVGYNTDGSSLNTGLAGEVTNLSVAVSSIGMLDNMLYNDTYAYGITNFSKHSPDTALSDAQTYNLRPANTNWAPSDRPILQMRQGAPINSTSSVSLRFKDINNTMGHPASEGRKYAVSAYIGAHRCDCRIALVFRKADGTWLNTVYSKYNEGSMGSSSNPDLNMHLCASGVAPVDTSLVQLVCIKKDTYAESTSSYMFIHKPMLSEVSLSSDYNDTNPLPYSIGAVGVTAGAVSDLENTLNTSIVDGLAEVESKFAYNSNLTINGATYQSGFGINSSLIDSDSGIPTGTSEFWVQADKFRVVSAAGTANNLGNLATKDDVAYGSEVTGTPTSLSNINTTEGDKLTGIANNADVTAARIASDTLIMNASNSGIVMNTGGKLWSNNLWYDENTTNYSAPPANLSDHVGVMIGRNETAGNYQLYAGNASNYMYWNGTNLKVKGDISGSTMTGGTITGATLDGGVVDADAVYLNNLYRRTSWDSYRHNLYAFASPRVLVHTFSSVTFADAYEWNYLYSDVFDAYAFNSGPSGEAYAKHYYGLYVTAEVDLTISADILTHSKAVRVIVAGDDDATVSIPLALGAASDTREGTSDAGIYYERSLKENTSDDDTTYVWAMRGQFTFSFDPGNSRRLKFKIGSYHYPGGTKLSGTVKIYTG